MKTILKYFFFVTALMFSGCGIVKITINGESHYTPEEECCPCTEKINPCEECKIQPSSGFFRDRRHGYYYDPIEKKCKEIYYSSGGVPAPFETMEQCLKCCCRLPF